MRGDQQALFALQPQQMETPKDRRNMFKAGKKQMARHMCAAVALHLHALREEERIELRRPDPDVQQRARQAIENIDSFESWFSFNFERNYRVVNARNKAAIEETRDSRGAIFKHDTEEF